MLSFADVLPDVMAEWHEKSQKQIYRTDIHAWAADILGERFWSMQGEIAQSFMENRRTAVKSANGSGKVLAPDTDIPTPSGWVKAGSLAVGDAVLDEEGLPTRVTWKSPIWDRNYFRVSFDDGSYIDAHANHEWNVLDTRHREPKTPVADWRDHWDKSKTMTTFDMLSQGLRFGKNNTLRWKIPNARPLQFPDADLPIEPYLFGLWLADGGNRGHDIHIGETKLGCLDELTSRGHDAELVRSDDRLIIRVHSLTKGDLQDLDVYRNKHIPTVYLRASEAQRRELLAGIMDGDGFLAGGGGNVGIDMTREVLIDNIYELVTSLGSKVRRNVDVSAYTKDGKRHATGLRYRLNWRPLENPFIVRGQGWEDSPVQRSRHTARVIVDISAIYADESFCIEVESGRHLYLASRAMIPTHNSRLVGVAACHWVTTGEHPGDNLALITGPALKTVRDVIFQYLTDNYNKALARGHNFPGVIYSSLNDLAWRVPTTGKQKPSNMALGLKPGDGTDIVGAFQGRRGRVKTAVFADEAGSLHSDIYTAAEAVATGPESRHLFIGNPDNGRGSEFYRIFNEPGMEKDWKHFTISAFDLPTFTGEIVYPDDPDKQYELLNSGMPDEAWVDNKRRMWGEGTGRWKAKVLGEFPDDEDNALFSQTAIDRAFGTDISPDGEDLKLGVDLAFGGLDETVFYGNRGGHVRHIASFSKMEPLENARKIHEIATEKGAKQVRVDASGAGEGVFNMLAQLPEFAVKTYELIGIKGGMASPDPSQWAQARSWHYDQFRAMMLRNEIDLDNKDTDLKDEIISQTYDTNLKGAIQVTPKKEMKKHGLPSPDHLDAAIYATVDPFAKETPRERREIWDAGDVVQAYSPLFDPEFGDALRPAYRW